MAQHGPSLVKVPVRMDRLAVLPVFLKLGGKRAVMAGGTLPAVWKTELLSAAGAEVVVFAEAPCPELIALAENPPGGAVTLVSRGWRPEDLKGSAVAIGAIEDDQDARAFRDAARDAGVPVNVIDKPAFCDFQFGTIVNRSPLVIGISTDGAAPVFGQAIRARIEALLPQSLKAWAEAARDWRPTAQALDLDFRARRRFWEVFAQRALLSPPAEPASSDLDACREAALGREAGEDRGSLTLVGAGPGDPDAVTLKAIRALQAADLIVFDPEVTPAVVGFGRREATNRPLSDNEPDIIGLLLAEMAPGRHVVWLDRGNPETCERWRARARALAARGLRPNLVAGLGRCRSCTPDCAALAL